MAMPDIPMYVFTGFLESGKTKFIQETLEDERFNTGERTLLLVFEEGEEEYDVSAYPHKEVYEQVLDYEDLSPEMLTDLQKKYRAERVVVELNGMHLAADFYLKTPDHWKIAQEVMFADATTFLSYNANMRQLVVDKLAGAEMLVLNRMAPGTDVMPYHKIARAVNRKIDILYEYTDGSTHYDDIEDPLPFDLNAPVVEIRDEDYALFYRDITEEPKKYAGKTVKFKGQVARLRREKEGMFAPGRFVMTCCEADITFMGLPCRFAAASGLAARSWVWVTATVEVKFHTLYKGVGPILTAVNVQPAEPAQPEPEQATVQQPAEPAQPDENRYMNEEDQKHDQTPEPAQEQESVSCTSLTLSAPTVTFEEAGRFFNITFTRTPADCTEPVAFSSSDETVATVSEQGKIIAVNAGSAVITAQCGEQTAQCLVTCDFAYVGTGAAEGDPAELALNKDDLTFMNAGEQYTLSVTGAPDGAKITWQSSDESIVTVSENGVLTAKGKGTATVKAAVDDSELTCIVRCNFEDRSGEGECTISNSDVTMGVKGETFQISLRDANGDKITGLLWVSSDVSVCSVDGTGVVKAEGKGTAYVSTTYNGVTYQCIVRCNIK